MTPVYPRCAEPLAQRAVLQWVRVQPDQELDYERKLTLISTSEHGEPLSIHTQMVNGVPIAFLTVP